MSRAALAPDAAIGGFAQVGKDMVDGFNTVIKTYPKVSQFWTYGKETFLKQPVYSRDFPPCKFGE